MKGRWDLIGMALVFIGFLVIFTLGLSPATTAARLPAVLGGVAGVGVGIGLLVRGASKP
jgi:hypothetical protein